MSDRTELDEAADCAPFDRVEALARQMCADAGSDWDRKGTRKQHWRAKAAEALAGEGREPEGAGWFVAAMLGAFVLLLLAGALQ